MTIKLPPIKSGDHPDRMTRWTDAELAAIKSYAIAAVEIAEARHLEELNAYALTCSNLRAELAGQDAGIHPAPCARHCEARAFEIEIRGLQGEIARRGVPDGWWMVPVDPTLAQMAAMGPSIRACYGLDGVTGDVTGVYRAMLAAAPQPQAAPQRPINCGTGHCSCIECVVATETCKWTQDDEWWSTECGASWVFIDCGPVENGVKFCHGCGRPVEIVGAK